jgi:hypothetical protein
VLAGRACRAGAARPARGSLPRREAAFPGVDLMPPAARSDNCEERGSRAGPRSIRPRREAIDDDSVCGEGAKGADLIEPHQAAVAFDVGGEDRGELPFDRVRFQPRHLPDHYSPTGREIRASVNHSDARWWCMSVAEGDRAAHKPGREF